MRFAAITALRTDIAAFVGIVKRNHCIGRCRAIMRQFKSTFGSLSGSGYLGYAVKGFFENGGRNCYVVGVADRDVATTASIALLNSEQDPAKKNGLAYQGFEPRRWGISPPCNCALPTMLRRVPLLSRDRLQRILACIKRFELRACTLLRLFQAAQLRPSSSRRGKS